MSTRWMSKPEACAFMAERTEGRLATCDAAGQPYITPLSYVFHGNKIYFHSKLSGRKLDNIAGNARVCFETSQISKSSFSEKPCKCAVRYTSVLAFGRARVITDSAEKTRALNLLVAKFAAGRSYEQISEAEAATCAVVEISVDEISGKMNVDPGVAATLV